MFVMSLMYASCFFVTALHLLPSRNSVVPAPDV